MNKGMIGKGPPSWSMRRYVPLILVVVAGAALSLGVSYALKRAALSAVSPKFEKLASDRAVAIQNVLDRNTALVESVSGLYGASKDVERHEFRAFVKGFLERYSDIQALEWVPRVNDGARDKYEEAARKDGLEGFEFTELKEGGWLERAGRRGVYYPVFYVEPYKGNRAEAGFDMGSNAYILAALNRAGDNGIIVASPDVTPTKDEGAGTTGVLIFCPIYRKGAVLDTVEERRSSIEGFAVGVFQVGAMVESAMKGLQAEGIEMWVYDAANTKGPGEILYHHRSRPRREGRADEDEAASAAWKGIHIEVPLKLPGRNWSLLLSATPQFFAQHGFNGREGWEALAAGLLFTALAGAHMLGTIRRNVKTEALTVSLTEANTALEKEVKERKRSKEVLASSETRLRIILDNTVDAIITINERGMIESFNRSAERVFGYSADEALGKNVSMLMPSPYSEEHDVYIGNYLRTGKRKVIGIGREIVGRKKDGTVFPIDLAVSEVALGGRRIFTGMVRDITERKKAEEELLNAKEAADAANRTKSEFLATMSHEIRTPMNAIIGMADLLGETPLTAEQEEYVRVFRRAGNTLLSLINDILDISKIEAGKFELENFDFDLTEAVERTCEIMAIRAHKKGLELNCRIAPGVPVALVGDGDRLRQALINLVGNAVKFTERGEVSIDVRADKEPAAGDGQAVLRFTVRDTGIGIPPEKLDAVFEKFTQADASTTRKYGGTGLGLAITKKLIELMGGRIRVESRVGDGTTFDFTARFGIQEAPLKAIKTGRVDFAGLRALVVDDNETNRWILKELLSTWGMSVSEASDGQKCLVELALARNAGAPYQLILIDQQMPGMDGFEVARRLRDDFHLENTAVMMLTSDARSGDKAHARELGMAGYMTKPVKNADLMNAIASAVSMRATRVQAKEEAPEGPVEARPLRILLAEDTEDNRLLIRSYFKKTPHTLEMAENGRMAVEKFMTRKYDMVLMDMQMPVMDGYAATRRIRQWEKDHDLAAVPIIALTAHALKGDEAKSLEAGCDAHITKPVKKQALIEAVRQYAKEAVV